MAERILAGFERLHEWRRASSRLLASNSGRAISTSPRSIGPSIPEEVPLFLQSDSEEADGSEGPLGSEPGPG